MFLFVCNKVSLHLALVDGSDSLECKILFVRLLSVQLTYRSPVRVIFQAFLVKSCSSVR